MLNFRKHKLLYSVLGVIAGVVALAVYAHYWTIEKNGALYDELHTLVCKAESGLNITKADVARVSELVILTQEITDKEMKANNLGRMRDALANHEKALDRSGCK